MNSQQFVSFFEKVTRRLAQTFQEINQLCLQQLGNIQRQSSRSQSMPKPAQGVSQPPIDAPIQLDSEEEEPVKEVKTKKIKKENAAEEQPKEGDDSKGKRKIKKATHKPKAPASSFLLFFKDQQNNMAEAYPNCGVTQLTKVAAKLWKDLSKEQKDPYIKQCDQERRLYQQKMEKYRIEFPHQIAEKVKEKLVKRQKKNAGKDTPRKEKSQTDIKNTEQEALKGQNPKEIIEEQVIDSEQFMKGDMSDSLGIM